MYLIFFLTTHAVLFLSFLLISTVMSFPQSLHETDSRGAALLPRQQRHPPGRQGIGDLQLIFLVDYSFSYKLKLQGDCGSENVE